MTMVTHKFETTGATTVLWSYRSREEARDYFQALKDTGATSAIIDFHLRSPSLTESSVTDDPYVLRDLAASIEVASEVGLDVWIKPIVLIGPNDGLNWQQLNPSDKQQWFAEYRDLLLEVIAGDPAGNIDSILLTNELRTLTTDTANYPYWATLFSSLRAATDARLGFNAGGLLGDVAGQSEFELISDQLYALVDFVGISAYPRITGDTVADIEAGWKRDAYGNDNVAILRNFFERTDKDIYFTELGSPAIDGGNLGDLGDPKLDGMDPVTFFAGSSRVLAEQLSGEVDGVFVYSWSLTQKEGDTGGHLFQVNHQPTVDTIKDWFRSGTTISNEHRGTDSSDQLFGTSIGDQFFLSSGSDEFAGYGGIDVAIASGPWDSYAITVTGLSATLSGAGFSTILHDVERLEFSDGILALDIEGNAGQAYRLYQAVFEREPDKDGLAYWIGRMDEGASLVAVADSFLHSPEYLTTYGTPETVSNAEFIELLYQHTLDRGSDGEGFDYWLERLDAGATNRRDLLAQFSESPENKAQVADLISDGIWLPY